MRRVIAMPLLPLVLACATAKPVPLPPDPATLPPLPRSSLAAVLGHRGELDLTDDQVRLLQRLDDHLQEEDAAIQAEAAKEPPPEKRKKEDTFEPPMDSPSSAANPGNGMGMGMGGRGGGGGRHGTNQFKDKPAAKPVPVDKPLQERLDDNDTEAYENAERSVLKDSQTERARDIASKYREELFDRREMARKRAEAGK
jgi:hypothetical protein